MPVVKVWTSLSQEEYQRFRQRAQQRNMKDYELAQEDHIFCNHLSAETIRKQSVMLRLQKFLEWVWNDMQPNTF